MERYDHELAFMLKYENVAWFADGKVRILDRRAYPSVVEFVECTTYTQVIQAIKDMVTQSAGPYTAIGMGMALAAYECRELDKPSQLKQLEKAAYELSNARITTANRYKLITDGCLDIARKYINSDESISHMIFLNTVESLNRRYQTMEQVAFHLVDMFPENPVVLTQCFGETIVGMMCRVANQRNINIEFYNAETRPFLQGARLTASVCSEMGFSTTVISDNMVAYAMQYKGINVFTSAADTITLDGHIANKIGTYQIAILAKHFNIPYYVTGIPDVDKKDVNAIMIEERDPQLVMCMHGIKHTLEAVKAIYPSFDITPPSLITRVISDKGIYMPNELTRYIDGKINKFY